MSLRSNSNLGVSNEAQQVFAELQGLTISGPLAGAAAGTAIACTGIEIEDTIKKVLLEDATSGVIADDTANVTIVDRRAKGTLTVGSGVVDADTVVVAGKTYTFTEVEETICYNAPPQVVPISVGPSGVDVDVVADRLAKVIMSSDSRLQAVASQDGSGLVTIYFRTAGTGGNAMTLDVTGANSHITRSGATFSGGTATNAVKSTTNTTGKNLMVFWFNKN